MPEREVPDVSSSKVYYFTTTRVNEIIKFEPNTEIVTRITDGQLDLHRTFTVQVQDKLYGFLGVIGWGSTLKCFSNFINDRIEITTKAPPPRDRLAMALANFKDRFLFVSGSDAFGVLCSIMSSVDIYNIRFDTWMAGPDLNDGRNGHSSFALDDFIYVVGGSNQSRFTTSIERVNAEAVVTGY